MTETSATATSNKNNNNNEPAAPASSGSPSTNNNSNAGAMSTSNESKPPTKPPQLSVVKVYYWAGRGRCEVIRLLLAAAGVQFENVFMQSKEQFIALQQTRAMAYNQLPMVEFDGHPYVQSGSQFRYIAAKYGLWGGDNLEDAYTVDLIVEGAKDARSPLQSFPWHCDVERCLRSINFRRYCGFFETFLSKSESGYFLSKASAADVAVFEFLEFLELVAGPSVFKDKMQKYPNLMKNYALARKIGGIQEYIDNNRNHLGWKAYSEAVNATLR